MKVEQTGPNAIRVTLETDLEKATVGKAESLEVTLRQDTDISFRERPTTTRISVSRE